MRNSKTLARLRNQDPVRVCVLGHYIPAYICQAAHAGYDCIWLDLEHRAMTIHQVQALCAHAHLYDIDLLLRPPTLEKTGLYRYLEEGATGLLIPHVSTPEKARHLVESVKFPPLGDRGVDNAGLDSDYLQHDVDDYVAWANKETFLAVQIETPEALQNLEEIVTTPGVDLIFVGPGDLDLRLRQRGEMTLDEAYEQIADVCRRHGKPWGGPALPVDSMKSQYAQGARFLVGSAEFRSWKDALHEDRQRFEELG